MARLSRKFNLRACAAFVSLIKHGLVEGGCDNGLLRIEFHLSPLLVSVYVRHHQDPRAANIAWRRLTVAAVDGYGRAYPVAKTAMLTHALHRLSRSRRDRWFESVSLQRRGKSELDHGGLVMGKPAITSDRPHRRARQRAVRYTVTPTEQRAAIWRSEPKPSILRVYRA